MKKKIVSLMAAAAMALSAMATGISAYAGSTNGIWYIGQADDGEHPRYFGRDVNGSVSLDANVFSKTARTSLKLANTKDYCYTFAEKEVTLEPHTQYRFSAKVKYTGYKQDPEATGESGASLMVCTFNDEGNFALTTGSSMTRSKNWTEISCTFTTGADTQDYYLRLCNGMTNKLCKGTAWFNDIRLEKAKTTNDWNILAVFFKNVETDVDLHGKTTILKPTGEGLTHLSAAIADSDIAEIKLATNKLKNTLDELSGGLVDVKKIDYVTIDEPLTEMTEYKLKGEKSNIDGFRLDYNSDEISKVLDKYLAKKNYQQIIVYAPLSEIAGGWFGNGGSLYNGVRACQIATANNGRTRDYEGDDFCEGVFVHEILHGVDFESKVYDPDTPDLHENIGIYADTGLYSEEVDGWRSYYRDYMSHTLPDGRGVDPRAYYRADGYTLADSGMEVGGSVKECSKLPLDISKVKAAKISACKYTGKAVKPTVTLTDGKYKLKKGVDYTVTYKNNKKKGTASVIITGKGIYTGKKTIEFKIA